MVWSALAGAGANWALNKFFGSSGPTAEQQMAMNSTYQKDLMDYQNQLQRESRQTYWQDTKHSLLEAGYNPLYGIMGNGGAQSMSSSIPSNPAPSLMDIKMQKIAMAKQVQEMGIMTAQALADANFKNEQADTEQTKRDLNIAETGLKLAEKLGQEKNNSWIDKLNIQALKEGASRIFLNNATANANQMNANTNKYNAETERKLKAGEIARSLNDLQFTKEHPHWSNFGNWLNKHSKNINNISQIIK